MVLVVLVVGQQVGITSQGKKSNFGSKALRKEFSTPKLRQNTLEYSPDPNMGSLGLLEAKIIQ